MKMRPLLAVLLFVTSGTWAAQAMSPEETFNSDEALNQAQRDIAKMDVDELRLFADSLAQCTHSLSENELITNSCDVVRKRYAIEYESERTVDQLLWSISVVEMMIRNKGKSADGAMIARLAKVTQALEDTTNRVFYTLRPIREPN